MQGRLNAFADHPLVAETRGIGLLAALELKPGDAPAQRGALMNGIMQQNGVISRNMVDAMAFCPPLIVSRTEIDEMIAVVDKSLDLLQQQISM